jgi:hypothetical protein
MCTPFLNQIANLKACFMPCGEAKIDSVSGEKTPEEVLRGD